MPDFEFQKKKMPKDRENRGEERISEAKKEMVKW